MLPARRVCYRSFSGDEACWRRLGASTGATRETRAASSVIFISSVMPRRDFSLLSLLRPAAGGAFLSPRLISMATTLGDFAAFRVTERFRGIPSRRFDARRNTVTKIRQRQH